MSEATSRNPEHEPQEDLLDALMRSAFRQDSRWSASSTLDATAQAEEDAEGQPQMLGRYPVVERIGRGGVGAVYRVLDDRLGRTIALKVLRRAYVGNDELTRQFEDEARLSSQLAHPGIVPVHEIGRLDDGRPFFTMRLVEGETFASLLRRRQDLRQDRPLALEILRKTAEALAYAHTRGIVHGDVKPQNVMVGAFGEVQVLDWGFALRTHEAAGGKKRARGTPAYMAPEQARTGGNAVSARTDVFGLGGILCEILSGDPPFLGPTRKAVLELANTGNIAATRARLSAQPGDETLVELTLACLAAAPEDRPADAGVVASRITAYLDGVEARAHAAELAATEARAKLEASRRARRLATALAISIAAAVVVVTLILGIGLYLRGERRAATSAAVTQALTEAHRLAAEIQERSADRENQLREALAAARKARALVLSPNGDKALLPSVEAMERDLSAREVRLQRTRTLLRELDGLTHHIGEELPLAGLDAGYLRSFTEFAAGSDLGTALAALSDPEAKAAVIQGLDDWSHVRRRQSGRIGEAWRTPFDLVVQLDQHPWRSKLRAHWAAGETGQLVAMAQAELEETIDPFSLYLLGRVLTAAGRRKEAIDFYRRAVVIHPEDYRLCHDLAVLFPPGSPPEDQREAARLLWMACASRPEDAHLLIDLGLALTEGGFHPAAKLTLGRALRRAPENGRAWFVHSVVIERMGRPDSEVRSVRERAADLGFPAAIVWVADRLQTEGRLAKATDLLTTVLAREPGNTLARLVRSSIALHMEQGAAALQLLDEIKPQVPRTADVQKFRTLALIQTGRFQEAGEAARAGLAQDADSNLVAALNSLATQARRLAEISGRVQAASDQAGLPTSRSQLRTFANAAHALGRTQLALRAYEALLPVTPEHLELTASEELVSGAVTALKVAAMEPAAAQRLQDLALTWLGFALRDLEAQVEAAPDELVRLRLEWHRIGQFRLAPTAASSRPDRGPTSQDTAWQAFVARYDALGLRLGLP